MQFRKCDSENISAIKFDKSFFIILIALVVLFIIGLINWESEVLYQLIQKPVLMFTIAWKWKYDAVRLSGEDALSNLNPYSKTLTYESIDFEFFYIKIKEVNKHFKVNC